MKNLNQVNDQIKEVLAEGQRTTDKKERNALKKQLAKLNLVKVYLENGATEESVKRQIEQVEHYIQVHEDNFDSYSKPFSYSGTKRSWFNSKFQMSNKKKQLELLNFILK